MALVISGKVKRKLAQKANPVANEEIEQCFANRTGTYLKDQREDNKTDPPTLWFIAETDFGRKLKIAFIQIDENTIIKTAYEPDYDESRIYEKYSRTI
jgi:hypothetical protein